MNYNDKIKNEELKSTTTGEDNFIPEEKTNNTIPKDKTNIKIDNIITGDNPVNDLSPVDQAKIKRDNSEANKNNAKEKCWNILGKCMKVLTWIIGVAIVITVSYGVYYISSISEPMGKIKEKNTRFEKDIDDILLDIDALKEQLSNTREEFIKSQK